MASGVKDCIVCEDWEELRLGLGVRKIKRDQDEETEVKVVEIACLVYVDALQAYVLLFMRMSIKGENITFGQWGVKILRGGFEHDSISWIIKKMM